MEMFRSGDLPGNALKNAKRMSIHVRGRSREHPWGIELTKEDPTYVWSYIEEEDETDKDFLNHVLFLRNSLLGVGADTSKSHIVELTTKDDQSKELVHPVCHLGGGSPAMASIDLNYGSEAKVTFRLAQGEGPVHIIGQHFCGFPEYPDPDVSQSEFETTETSTMDESYSGTGETGDTEETGETGEDEGVDEPDDDDEEDKPKSKAARKRKASLTASGKKKKGKVDVLEEDDEEGEEEDMEEDMEEEEEVEITPKNKGRKGKGKDKGTTPTGKRGSFGKKRKSVTPNKGKGKGKGKPGKKSK